MSNLLNIFDELEDLSKLHCISFSGGKDSTAMLLMMIEKGMQIDKIIFCDTGKEFPQMHEHIKKVKEYIYPYTIDTVTFDFDYYFSKYGFPSIRKRWCTRVKVDLLNQQQKEAGKEVITYIGYDADENYRLMRKSTTPENFRFPLVEWEIDRSEALIYCYNKGFNWGGLYDHFQRVSCWCCPLQGLKDLKQLFLYYPDLWNQLKVMEKQSNQTFRLDFSIEELEAKFTYHW